MKKFLFAFIFIAIISLSTAFADHNEKKLGLGIMGGWYGGWDLTYFPSVALSLKIPDIPVFWSVNLRFGTNYFNLGVSGDYYFIERDLVSDIFLHWFIGIGGWVNVGLYSKETTLSFGARLPLGIHWHIIEFLEVFTNIAPSLGISVKPFDFPAGGFPIEIGVRFWL